MRSIAGLFLLLAVLTGCSAAEPAPAAAAPTPPGTQSHSFETSDGVRLHYLESGSGQTIVFIPGWDMPGWIFQHQIDDFSRRYHVVALDPRSQGESEIAPSGHEPVRRGQDISEMIAQVSQRPVLLVGWSLGVLDVLAYVHTHGDAMIAGLVLIDNSVGEEAMRSFVDGMFRTPQPPEFLDRLTDSALRTPPNISAELLRYPVPRTYWKEAIYSTDKPVLYVVRPGLSGQADNLQVKRPNTQTEIFADAGHALFIDDAGRFDTLMRGFITKNVWR